MSLALHNSPEFYHWFLQEPPFPSPPPLAPRLFRLKTWMEQCPLKCLPWILWLAGQGPPLLHATSPQGKSCQRRGHLLRTQSFPCLIFSTPSDAAGSYQLAISGPRPCQPKTLKTVKFFVSSSLPVSCSPGQVHCCTCPLTNFKGQKGDVCIHLRASQ
jgi:hypothetical protein